jgi:hypothetical protein
LNKLTKRLGLIKAGIKILEDIGWNGQRATTTGLGIITILPCCEEILKEKRRSLSRQNSVLVYSSRIQGLVHRHLLDIGDDGPDDLPYSPRGSASSLNCHLSDLILL